ncbi:MAG: BamA/TamA family outer membrane protein [Chitinispirillales bacterium]|nr:BamA/TamA family outer membrane protein [Chitinispirillales bacterium]
MRLRLLVLPALCLTAFVNAGSTQLSSGVDSVGANSESIQPLSDVDTTIEPIRLPDSVNAATSSNNASVTQPLQKNSAPPPYIRGIEIYGNKTTRLEILRHYFAFGTGEVLDTSKLRLTRANLYATQLYDKVDIFPHMREDGAHIFIILKESVRLDLGYGAEYSTRKYGREDFWYKFLFDAAVNNFRGRMETFWFGVSAWEYLALNLSWHKPFLPTPYYIALGAGIADYPDDALPLDYLDVYAKLTAGRKLWQNSRVFLSAMPMYRHRDIVAPALNQWTSEPLPEPELTPEEPAPSSEINADRSAQIAFAGERDFYEAFAAVGFATDRRSARFDPKSGWLFHAQLSTNRLYMGVNAPYFQLTNEFRHYVPLFGDGVAAFRIAQTLRDVDAGAYHRLSYGGAGEIRGYANDALGWNFSAQSSVLASVKYYKPIYKTPPLPIPIINLLFPGVREMVFRIDATLIADGAMLYREPQGALTQTGQTQGGLAFGFGTRILAPRIRQSGCIDLVFGRTETQSGGVEWEPALHVYLDTFF